jgi:hypothetical protein
MKDIFDQQRAHNPPTPATGSRQDGQTGGSTRSNARDSA